MRVIGDQGRDAADVVKAILDAMECGDAAAAYELIDPDVIYINTGHQPFEVRGRDAYVSFITSVGDVYSAPRTHEILGIDAFTPSMAGLRAQVTVADVTCFAILFHYVRDGRVVELIDVIEDRARNVAPYVNPDVIARLQASNP